MSHNDGHTIQKCVLVLAGGVFSAWWMVNGRNLSFFDLWWLCWRSKTTSFPQRKKKQVPPACTSCAWWTEANNMLYYIWRNLIWPSVEDRDSLYIVAKAVLWQEKLRVCVGLWRRGSILEEPETVYIGGYNVGRLLGLSIMEERNPGSYSKGVCSVFWIKESQLHMLM